MSPREVEHLERYLDGLMQPGERAQFERELAESASLREQVELQGRIDAGLRRLMEPGAALEASEEVVVVGRLWRPAWVAAAAVIAVVAAAGWWLMTRPPSGPDPLEAEYRQIVAAGFEPHVVCTTDEQFRDWVYNKFGEPLQPRPDRGGVQYVGWNSSRVLSSYSGLLLARAEGAESVVLIDRTISEDKRLPRPADPGLHQYRRVVGGLVLYEITPLDHPAVLDSLMRP